ncbi:MAG TPA: hypothetical protein VG755_16110 [Nannocystaceae bacterium]|nr:hypothetical protein [Nannocystaceae bacterium]
MRLPRTDLLALVIAGVSTLAVVAITMPTASTSRLSEDRARAEAATYLTEAPAQVELQSARWKVSDGRDTAWIDAKTGELVEIEFAAP